MSLTPKYKRLFVLEDEIPTSASKNPSIIKTIQEQEREKLYVFHRDKHSRIPYSIMLNHGRSIGHQKWLTSRLVH